VIRWRRAFLVSVPLALLACAGASSGPARPSSPSAAAPSPAARPSPLAGAPAAPSPAPPVSAVGVTSLEQLPPRTQRLFAEAVQAPKDLEREKLPPDWALVERRWRAVLEAVDLAEAHYNLGVALEAQGQLAEARAEYERARSEKPGLRQASVNLGVLDEKAGDLRGAQATYAAVVHDFLDDARARERLGALYLNAGQLDLAAKLAREALLRDPRSVAANKVLLRVAAQRNQLELAKLIALRTAKLDPADPELPFLQGEILAREKDEAGAEAAYKKALDLYPRFVPARSALLRAALARGRFPLVAEHAKALLEVTPADPAVELALGIALRHTGKTEEALSAYGRAEQLSGDKLAEVHLARGLLFMQVRNECEPALEEFRRYAQLAGPMAATESPVLKLERECEGILDENKKALEAAREMQRSAAEKRAAASGGPETTSAAAENGGAGPTPAPVEVP